MNKLNLRCTVCALLLIVTSLPHARENQTNLQWLEPADTLEKLTRAALQESNIVSDFAAMVKRDFQIGERLSIVVGGQGRLAFNRESATLTIPYSYLSAVVRAQGEIVEDRELALSLGMDMVEYSLYHLFGHILVDDMTADTDDAAETISTWIMLTRWPNGGEQWFASVQAFGKASQVLDGPLSDYWHSHSLYKARQRELECFVLGSDPARYEQLLNPVLEQDARRSRCSAAWKQLDERIRTRLQPLMTQP